MAVPVVLIDETNGSGATDTPGITGIVYASSDLPSSTAGLAAAHPILSGANSFEKWLRAKVATAATTSLDNFTVGWSPTAPVDAAGSSNTITVKFGVDASYVQPTANASIVATAVCAGASPTAITAPANTVGAYGGYITSQLQVGPYAAFGDMTFPAQWMTLSYTYV